MPQDKGLRSEKVKVVEEMGLEDLKGKVVAILEPKGKRDCRADK